MSVLPSLLGEELSVTEIILDGETVTGVTEAKANISFTEEGKVQGYGGCNRFFGSYQTAGYMITFSAIASTRRYCQETMAVEDALFMALGKVTRLITSVKGLDLLSEDGRTKIAAVIKKVDRDE
jgi:putative lipoprotein